MARAMTVEHMVSENRAFEGTGGVSGHNREHGFVPAFRDSLTGIVYASRNPDGTPAICHRLDGLPDELAAERDESGRIISVRPSVVAGFERNGRFYTREQAAAAVATGT